MIYKLKNKIPQIEKNSFIQERADVIGDVVLKENSNIWFGAVLRGDIEQIIIGENSNVQDNSAVHTDFGFPCTVGRNVTVGHNVMLHGCEIGNNVLIGMGSTILNGAKIANDCLIGANSLVTHKIPYEEGMLILGNPAKIVRKLTEEEKESIIKNANHYSKNAKEFEKELKEM